MTKKQLARLAKNRESFVLAVRENVAHETMSSTRRVNPARQAYRDMTPADTRISRVRCFETKRASSRGLPRNA